MSLRGDILDALAQRLTTVTTTNGYSLSVRQVYYDKIPMGIQLATHQLPAVFMLDGDNRFTHEHQMLDAAWTIDLQLWNRQVGDKEQADFVRDVLKAVFANSPTAETHNGFRVHPSVTSIRLETIINDLHMIEANRVSIVSLLVNYRTRAFNL